GGHCPAWDRTARSTRTAPTTAQSAPSRQEMLPAASSWRSVQTPPSPVSAASSPTHAHQSVLMHIISRSLTAGFCRASLKELLLAAIHHWPISCQVDAPTDDQRWS